MCLTFKPLPAFSSSSVAAGTDSGSESGQGAGAAMASETDDLEAAADRLEAAIERIAQAAAHTGPGPAPVPVERPAADASAQQIAARLDELIERLHAALGGKAD